MKTIPFYKLDERTKNYLKLVIDESNDSIPGICSPKLDIRSQSAFWIGLIGMVCFLILFYTDLWDDPTGDAFLQLAVLIPSLWLLAYPIRIARRRAKLMELKPFAYADSLYLYDCHGAIITMIPLEELREISTLVETKEENYISTIITMILNNKENKVYEFKVNHLLRGKQLKQFFEAVIWMNESKDHPMAQMPPAIRGAFCRHYALYQEFPVEIPPNEILVDELPEPEMDHRSGESVLPSAIVMLLVGTVFFFLLREMNQEAQDDALFQVITQRGNNPTELRLYLLDPKKTRHRPEVLERLSAQYASVSKKFQETKDRDSDIAPIFDEMITRLGTSLTDIITLRVIEDPKVIEGQPEPRAGNVKDRQSGVALRFGKAMISAFGPNRIELVTPPEDIPVQIEIRYHLERIPKDTQSQKLFYEISLRLSPDEPIKLSKKYECKIPVGVVDPSFELNRVGEEVLTQFGGQYLKGKP